MKTKLDSTKETKLTTTQSKSYKKENINDKEENYLSGDNYLSELSSIANNPLNQDGHKDTKPNLIASVQAKPKNNTGLPNQLKSGIENLSGYSMDDVKVHYNSSKPAAINAKAYTKGREIHVSTGQEKHLPHEAWHVIQQKQGRVNPTSQTTHNKINSLQSLEKDATHFGNFALNVNHLSQNKFSSISNVTTNTIQGEFDVSLADDMIGKDVIVSTQEYSRRFYGRRGTIVRRSTVYGKWTIEFPDEPGELYRIWHHELKLASDDSSHVETDAVKEEMPAESTYRLYKSKPPDGDWVRLELTKQEDGSLLAADGTLYRLLNIKPGSDVPFVSKEAERQDAQPTPEFITFLEGFGFKTVGSGTIQDRLHMAVVKVPPEQVQTLNAFLAMPQNGKWYTNNIRQGGLNELILTSDSVAAASRAGIDVPGRDKVGRRGGHVYTFVQLQRDSSYPTKDFVFKDTFDSDDGKYQNSHVNARMYYIDVEGKKHRTVGPVSPVYHLSMEKESLKFHFEERTTMKSLVYDLIELHKRFLATKADILSVKASERGAQVYEMRGGDLLKLNDPTHLLIFADIVQNHTNSVIQKLKDIHASLENPEGGVSSPRPDLSPTHYSSVMSPGGLDDI